MIVRSHLKLRRIVRYTWKPMMWVVAGLALGLLLYVFMGVDRLHIGVPLATLGTALAILLGFKNNNAYDRWWEARRLWGQLVNASRLFTAGTLALPAALAPVPPAAQDRQRQLVYRQIAFAYALKQHLRRLEPWTELAALLPAAEVASLRGQQNVPNALLLTQAQEVAALAAAGYLDGFRHVQLANLLTPFYDILGGCERIKNTVFPRQYTVYTGWATHLFLLLLPLSMGEQLGWISAPFSLAIGFVYAALAYVGNHIENPFENDVNDTPMSALARTIDINLRQSLGETDLPAAAQPHDGYLF